MSADKSSPEKQSHPVGAGLLYRLMIAFPSWAGVFYFLVQIQRS